MRAFKPNSPIALFVALNNSFKDHVIGSRLFRFHPKHLHTIYVRAEANDWPTLRLHITRPHRRKQSKHNKIALTKQALFLIIQGKGIMNTFIQIQCPANIVPPQVETPLRHPQNIARVCGAPCPPAAVWRPSGHFNGVHLRLTAVRLHNG